MIPCIEEKCITYPVCQNKIIIECPKLKKLMDHMEDSLPTKEMWSLIHEYFPDVLAVHDKNINKSSVNDLESIFIDREEGVAKVLLRMDKILR
jgi:hypothetical protein